MEVSKGEKEKKHKFLSYFCVLMQRRDHFVKLGVLEGKKMGKQTRKTKGGRGNLDQYCSEHNPFTCFNSI